MESQVKAIKEECGKLRHVSVFFERRNFIIKNYHVLSGYVHMILEFDKKEVQIESANCGYYGAGPIASVEVLAMLGLNKEMMEFLIYKNHALDFDVDGQNPYNIDTSSLFYSSVEPNKGNTSIKNRIECNQNISIDMERRKIRIYNPQRTCWRGFLNLLSYMENIRMEYYIGLNNPLEGGLYIGKGFDRELRLAVDKPDIRGTDHVNLCLFGSNFSVVCLIDKEDEVPVIEATYLALTGTRLFTDEKYPLYLHKKLSIGEVVRILKNKNQEFYDRIEIEPINKGKR